MSEKAKLIGVLQPPQPGSLNPVVKKIEKPPTKEEVALQEAIKDEKEKREAREKKRDEKQTKRGEEQGMSRQERKILEKQQLGDNIELVSSDDKEDAYVGDLELADRLRRDIDKEEDRAESQAVNVPKSDQRGKEQVDSKETDELIRNGEEFKTILLRQQEELEKKGKTDSQPYQENTVLLDSIEKKLEQAHATQQQEKPEPVILDESNRINNDDDVIDAEFEEVSGEGSAEQKIDRPNTSEVQSEEEQLRNTVNIHYEAFVEAQKRLTHAENGVGMIDRIREDLKSGKVTGKVIRKGGSDEASKEYAQAKELFGEAEKSFQVHQKEYTKFFIKDKEEELLTVERGKLQGSDEEVERKLKRFKECEGFREVVRTFMVSEKVVSVQREKEVQPGQLETVEENVSLFEDMNEKVKGLNKAKLESMSERERNSIQKLWDRYQKQPKHVKIAVGMAISGVIAGTATLAGGASASVAFSVATLSGGKRFFTGIAGMVAGGATFKIAKGRFTKNREKTEMEKEKKFTKEVIKDPQADLYEFMKDRLAQDRNDTLKSMVAAGATGFIVGGGMRTLFAPDLPVSNSVDQGGTGIEVQGGETEVPIKEVNETVEAGGTVEKVVDHKSTPAQAKINKEIKDDFYTRADELSRMDEDSEGGFVKGFVAWEELKKMMTEKGQENSDAFKELESTYGEEAEQKLLDLDDDAMKTHNEVLAHKQDIYMDWKELVDGTTEVPPGFRDLVIFDLFKDFVEEKHGHFNSHDPKMIDQWREYRELIPEEASNVRELRSIDSCFDRLDDALTSRTQDRALDDINRMFSNFERDYEMRIHGAELAEKMGVDFDPYAEKMSARLERGVPTQINGHEVPLELLSEEDQKKVLFSRKVVGMNEISEKSDETWESRSLSDVEGQTIDRTVDLGTETNQERAIENSNANSLEDAVQENQRGSAVERETTKETSGIVAEVEAIRAKGETPSAEEMREYKRAMIMDEMSRQTEMPTEQSEPISGIGEEEESVFEKSADDVEDGDQGEALNFQEPLKRHDTVWGVLEKRMGGDQEQVANTLVDFQKGIARELVDEQGLRPNDARNFIHWRFRHLDPGDVVALNNGRLEIDNFMDKNNVGMFVDKFNVNVDEMVVKNNEGTKLNVVEV